METVTLKELEIMYPLFKWESADYGFVVEIGEDKMPVPSLTPEIKDRLDMLHVRYQKKILLHEKYPNLHISIQGDRGLLLSVWRESGVGESIGRDNFSEDELAVLNDEAGKARQSGWFFCIQCKKAKPQTRLAKEVFHAYFCVTCAETENT